MSPKAPSAKQSPPAGSDPDAERQALDDALAALMAPLAQLAVARGLPFAAVEEMLKAAFVQVAGDAHPALLAHRARGRLHLPFRELFAQESPARSVVVDHQHA